MKTKTWFLVVVVLGALVISACQQAPSVAYIQGVWSYEDLHLKPISGEMHYIENWVIDRGSFSIQGCCFTDVDLTGSYRILDADDDSVTLELYGMRGSQGSQVVSTDAVTTVLIRINPDGTIDIGRNKGFIRISEAIGD
jgi:hypothetical protein